MPIGRNPAWPSAWLKGGSTGRELARFVLVGLGNSALYAVIVLCLTKGLGAHPQLANHVALAAAAAWAYLAHRSFTFAYQGSTAASLRRYVVQIALFYLLSTAIYAVVERSGADILWGVLAVVIIVPLSSYLVMKLWTFAGRDGT